MGVGSGAASGGIVQGMAVWPKHNMSNEIHVLYSYVAESKGSSWSLSYTMGCTMFKICMTYYKL
jgi:hypothetical protein